jgi:FdhD protein
MSRTARWRVLRISLPAPEAGAQADGSAGQGAAGNGSATPAGPLGAGIGTRWANGVAAPASAGGGNRAEPVMSERPDLLAVEEPLEIRTGRRPLAVTMRTPGDDIDLAAGFLFTEGVVQAADDIAEIRKCDDNVADVRLRPGVILAEEQLRRNFLTTSACGLCGKESIDAVRTRASFDVAGDQVSVDPAALARLPGRLRDAQRVFERTGGLHAAAVFSRALTMLALREDVGRHNAVDKVIGWALRAGQLPLRGCVLLVSGRASFELAQKALMAGIPVLAAVSAPSSLAVELADEAGLTVVGFLRDGAMNVYTGVQRLQAAGSSATDTSATCTEER